MLFCSFFSCKVVGLETKRSFASRVGKDYLPFRNQILSNPGLYETLYQTAHISNLARSETKWFLRPNRAQKLHRSNRSKQKHLSWRTYRYPRGLSHSFN
jgi:hypothetical protein